MSFKLGLSTVEYSFVTIIGTATLTTPAHSTSHIITARQWESWQPSAPSWTPEPPPPWTEQPWTPQSSWVETPTWTPTPSVVATPTLTQSIVPYTGPGPDNGVTGWVTVAIVAGALVAAGILGCIFVVLRRWMHRRRVRGGKKPAQDVEMEAMRPDHGSAQRMAASVIAHPPHVYKGYS
ncbi:hypothetical protein P153DRAFT_368120 [Dothidotthia symphoricarpi CBS 119687]|uniref:Uncharacterized protein n=1 Tax=Dothidotthia symphoricarpi CBS 119687 TaxID=1392245 RepID=A0A6A6A8T1_9PLEO|nr:uncharacterized protein P153DRAFT_368120 [Dothidotthia symphoricarpi CBS 119687]KAF2127484.1 hypothetical protein P153DRAFT_368120 [Dothidotthia symphoricarpi CBS 119687]